MKLILNIIPFLTRVLLLCISASVFITLQHLLKISIQSNIKQVQGPKETDRYQVFKLNFLVAEPSLAINIKVLN